VGPCAFVVRSAVLGEHAVHPSSQLPLVSVSQPRERLVQANPGDVVDLVVGVGERAADGAQQESGARICGTTGRRRLAPPGRFGINPYRPT
jgi:hypothetical protein